jgi:hypothetical protein
MQIRLLVVSLVLGMIMVSVGSTFVEQTVSATTDNRSTTHSTMAQASPCANGQESGLPLPSAFLPAKVSDFQSQLKSFLTSGKYRTLNWSTPRSV